MEGLRKKMVNDYLLVASSVAGFSMLLSYLHTGNTVVQTPPPPPLYSQTCYQCNCCDCSVVLTLFTFFFQRKTVPPIRPKHLLRLHKKINSPFTSETPLKSCSDPEKVTNETPSPNQQHSDTEDDSIPPTPLPASRHSFLKARMSSSGSERQTPLSLQTAKLNTATNSSTCRRSLSDQRLSYIESTETCRPLKIPSSAQRNVSKATVDLAKVGTHLTDNITVKDSEIDSSLARQPSPNVGRSWLTLKSTKKAYKLSRKRNPRRVTSSPVQSKSVATGTCKASPVKSKEVENVVTPCGHTHPVIIAPSKCKLSKSKTRPVKRSAKTGASPAHKRQQTVPVDKVQHVLL